MIMMEEEEEEEEQIFFWRRNLRLWKLSFFFFLSFLNWDTCTCMERRGEEVEDDDDEELLGWGDWLPLA